MSKQRTRTEALEEKIKEANETIEKAKAEKDAASKKLGFCGEFIEIRIRTEQEIKKAEEEKAKATAEILEIREKQKAEYAANEKLIEQKRAEIAETDKKHREEIEVMQRQIEEIKVAAIEKSNYGIANLNPGYKTLNNVPYNSGYSNDSFVKAAGIAHDALNPDSGNHKIAVKKMQRGGYELIAEGVGYVASDFLKENQFEIEQIGEGIAKLAGLGSAVFDAAFGGDESSESF